MASPFTALTDSECHSFVMTMLSVASKLTINDVFSSLFGGKTTYPRGMNDTGGQEDRDKQEPTAQNVKEVVHLRPRDTRFSS